MTTAKPKTVVNFILYTKASNPHPLIVAAVTPTAPDSPLFTPPRDDNSAPQSFRPAGGRAPKTGTPTNVEELPATTPLRAVEAEAGAGEGVGVAGSDEEEEEGRRKTHRQNGCC